MEWMFIMLLLCSCKIALSLSFTATPDRVVIGDTGTLTLACSVTESDVSRLYDIRISRTITPGSTTKERLASFESGTATLSKGITNDKGFSVTGDINGASSRLELSMDKTKLMCSDARLYRCEVAYDSSATGSIEIVENILTLQVFVLPQMLPPLQAKRNGYFIEGGTQSDRAKFEVGDQLELQCSANIGSIDTATITWRKTSELDSSQFKSYQPLEGSYDDGTPLSDNQCGYTRTATLRYNVTTPVTGYDLAFECYVSVSGYPSSTLTPSGLYTTRNNLRYYVEVSSSLSFTATPDRVVIGDTGTLTLACSVTESDVSTLYGMTISRAITPGSTTKELLASFESGTATLSDRITNDKGFSVTGYFNGASSRLELSMDKTKLTCSDARLYRCEVTYDSSDTNSIETVENILTLQVFVLPQMLPPLQAKRNGYFIEGGTQSDRAKFEVGDQLQLQCSANIGSIDSVTIRWRKTSELDSGQFIGYQPEEGSYDDGTPLSDNQCGYTRTATLRYNVTTPVTGYDLAFECYVSVSGYPSSTLTPSGLYTTRNNLQYHVEVLRETSQSTTVRETSMSTTVRETSMSVTERQTTQTLSTLDVDTSCTCSTSIASLVGVAIGSVAVTLIVIGVVLVVTKCLRMQNGNRKERKAEISVSQDAVDTNHVYINENQYPATNIGHAAPAEYEALQESAREPNTYSNLHIGQ